MPVRPRNGKKVRAPARRIHAAPPKQLVPRPPRRRYFVVKARFFERPDKTRHGRVNLFCRPGTTYSSELTTSANADQATDKSGGCNVARFRPSSNKTHEESVMKCSNPDCNRGIGLVSHRRGWFGKRRYCSRQCRDTFVPPNRPQQQPRAATFFEWLILEPIEQPTLKSAFACVKVARPR